MHPRVPFTHPPAGLDMEKIKSKILHPKRRSRLPDEREDSAVETPVGSLSGFQSWAVAL